MGLKEGFGGTSKSRGLIRIRGLGQLWVLRFT